MRGRSRVLALAAAALLLLPDQSGAAGAPPERSVRDWTRCDGTSDDRDAFATALASAAHGAFTLRVDCPLRLEIGADIARPLFIDSGTTVRFSAAGSITVDNVLQPAFMLANARDVTLTGWRIRYAGETPVDPFGGGVVRAGAVQPSPRGRYATPGAFNDTTVEAWLAAHRGLRFTRAHPWWPGPANLMAVLVIAGDSQRVTVRDMTMTGASEATPARFVPVAIGLVPGFRDGLAVNPAIAKDSSTVALPSAVLIDGLTLDGYLMGILGQTRDTTIRNVHALRYSDLQGGDQPVGGATQWFPPPHLIYLRSLARATGLVNRSNRIEHVVDEGRVVGAPRASGGNACSLKIGSDDSVIDDYVSNRPDGVVQPLEARNLIIRHVRGSYDSSFGAQKPNAARFVSGPYQDVVLQDFDVTDVAPVAAAVPVAGPTVPGSSGIRIERVTVRGRRGAGDPPKPATFFPRAADKIDVRLQDLRK